MQYSASIAAVLALLLTALSLNISRLRLAHKVGFGDGGIKELTYAVRAHGNSLEQSLLFIVLLYFIETTATNSGQGNGQLVLFLGIAFVGTRVIYCAAMFKKRLLVRQIAHAMTLALQLAATLIILLN